MRTYANIDEGVVQYLLPTDGDITKMFHPSMVWVDVTDIIPQPMQGWTYVGGVFAPYKAPSPSPEEVLVIQSAKLQTLTQFASTQKAAITNRISTLNDAIELEMATTQEVDELPVRDAQLKTWKTYAVLLGRVTSQVGWPPEVDWPIQPTEGIDLTVSATFPKII